MKNFWTILSVVLIIIGSGFACFTDILSDIPALAIAAFGLGALIVSTWQKSEKKNWLTIVAIVCICIGGFCCAIAALSQDTMTKLIAAVVALVMLVSSILVPILVDKIKKKE